MARTRTVAAVGRLTGFLFAVRNAGVLVCVRTFHMEPSAGAAATLALGPVLLLLLTFHSVGGADCIEGAPSSRFWASAVTRWLTAYLAFAGCSLFWTIAVSPVSSGAYWCGLVVDAAIVSLLLKRYPAKDVARAVLRGYLFGACVLAAVAWIMPMQADLRLGDPDFFNTNQIANLCALAIFFAQYLQSMSPSRSWLPLLFLSVTLLRTLSKTTILAFAISQALLLYRDRSISLETRKRILLCAAVVMIASAGLLTSYYNVYTNASNQAETLTGRTTIWGWALSRLQDSPWIGHGFDSMWKVMPPYGIDRFEARHAENEVLQQLYAYGLIGTVLFAGVYCALFLTVRRSYVARNRLLMTALLLFIVVRGLAEAEPFDLLLPTWVVLLFGSLPARGIESNPASYS